MEVSMPPARPLDLPIAAALVAAALSAPCVAQQLQPPAKGPDPERIRGEIESVEGGFISMRISGGGNLRIALPEAAPVFALSRSSFTELDFGTYVGAVSEKLGDNVYSPIVRDSLSWLHKGFELRLIDESLRGIAVGHAKWDLTPQSVMTHGWVDDLEDRVISIKYGPTEEEETDVEVPREVPVLRMSQGDRSLVRPGASAMVGAQKAADGSYTGVFVFVGRDGIKPPL
jgi:hypothetical protein